MSAPTHMGGAPMGMPNAPHASGGAPRSASPRH
jgi:hypothetical protein